MKYMSPMKYILELVYRAEFQDSKLGTFYVEQFNYNLGDQTCRIVLLSMFVGFRLLGFVIYQYNARKML